GVVRLVARRARAAAVADAAGQRDRAPQRADDILLAVRATDDRLRFRIAAGVGLVDEAADVAGRLAEPFADRPLVGGVAGAGEEPHPTWHRLAPGSARTVEVRL